MTLALVNSRAYQSQVEEVYIRALDVTLQRWDFQPQFIAGMSPSTPTSAGSPGPNFANSYLYRTNEVNGGTSQASNLSLGTLLGFGKALSFGGSILAGFANEVVFNFTGANPIQPRVQSVLPLRYVQPFLRGGGRAVTLEPLTLAERNLLYQVRNFARFRQTFFPNVLTSGQADLRRGGGGGRRQRGLLAGSCNSSRTSRTPARRWPRSSSCSRASWRWPRVAARACRSSTSIRSSRASSAQRGSLITSLNQLPQPARPVQDPARPAPGCAARSGSWRHRSHSVIRFDEIDEWFTDAKTATLPTCPSWSTPCPNSPTWCLTAARVRELGKDPYRLEELLLAAERIALENRFELMNARAQLYDEWRQLAVTCQRLEGDLQRPPQQPVLHAFQHQQSRWASVDQASQFNITINAELPLVRLNERNLFRLVADQLPSSAANSDGARRHDQARRFAPGSVT